MTKPLPPPRLADVARLARVSAVTVSRALRLPDTVSPATRDRIAQAVEATGYVRNRVAGSLASSRSNVVAMIIPSIRNSLFAATVQAVAHTLKQHGHAMILGESGYGPTDEEAMIEAFLAQRPCAIVLHNTAHTSRARTMLARAGIPVVETGDLVRDPVDSVVAFSNAAAGRAMTLHLAERGCRHIGFVSLPIRQSGRAAQRRRGYLQALKRLGLDAPSHRIVESPGSFEGGARALVDLLETDPAIDGVFFAGDVFAVGAVLEAQRRHWPVPGRVAIAGFDDLEIAPQLTPALTTMDIDRGRIGTEAATIILDRLDARHPAARRIDVGFSILHRAST